MRTLKFNFLTKNSYFLFFIWSSNTMYNRYNRVIPEYDHKLGKATLLFRMSQSYDYYNNFFLLDILRLYFFFIITLIEPRVKIIVFNLFNLL